MNETSSPGVAAFTEEVDVAVVGGGISGMTTAYWLERSGIRVRVLEGGGEAGGMVRTEALHGFHVDMGPGSLTLGSPGTAALLESLGLLGELTEPNEAGRRYVVKRGSLVPLPSSPAQALTTPLLSLSGRLRALAEPFVRPASRSGDETVHSFLARRFGQEAARTLGQAMVAGVAAGDPERISAAAVFPQLAQAERSHGSVLRGMIAARGRTGSARRAATFRGGMGRLSAALAAALGSSLKTGASVTSIGRHDGGYELTDDRGSTVLANRVVLATPSHVAADLLGELVPEAARALAGIPYAPATVVALGYRSSEVPAAPRGFGFLAPRGQGVRSLGVMNASWLSPDVSPPGTLLFRAICGGALDPGFVALSDSDKVAAVRRDLAVALGIHAEPIMTKVFSWQRAIPQYVVGHGDRLAAIGAALGASPGLHLVGNAYRGLGVGDCLRDAKRLAETLIAAASVKADLLAPR